MKLIGIFQNIIKEQVGPVQAKTPFVPVPGQKTFQVVKDDPALENRKNILDTYQTILNENSFPNLPIQSQQPLNVIIGDDVPYKIAGYMRNAKTSTDTISKVAEYSRRDGIDPNVLLASIFIETSGTGTSDKPSNIEDYKIKTLERNNVDIINWIGANRRNYEFNKEAAQSRGGGIDYNATWDLFAKNVGYLIQPGYYGKGQKLMTPGQYNDNAIQQKVYGQYIPIVKNLNKTLSTIRDYTDLHSRFLRDFGLNKVNPKQQNLRGVRHNYLTMIKAGADIIRSKKIFGGSIKGRK